MDTDSLKEKLQEAKENLQEAASDAVEKVKEVATDAAENAQEAAGTVTAEVKEVAKEVVADAKEDFEKVSEKLEEPAKPQVKAETPKAAPTGPAVKLPTDRGLIKFILLSFVTFGIYSLYVFTKVGNEVNTVCSKHDNKSSMNFIVVWLLSFVTCGIVPLVWYHNLCNRIGAELNRRQLPCSFSANTFWGWCVLGMLIVIGPYVFIHKFFGAMNTLNTDYNIKG